MVEGPKAPAPAEDLEPSVRRGRARAGRREMKVPITYKHRESNFRVLKKISQRLDTPIGDLLDEALEARFPEWRAKIAQLPPEEF